MIPQHDDDHRDASGSAAAETVTAPDGQGAHPHAHHHRHHHGHGHGHGHSHGAGEHGTEPDWEALADHLERQAELDLPVLESAAAWLRDITGGHEVTRLLDLGAGPGVATVALAHAFPAAEAVAVDSADGLLARARDRAAAAGLGGRLTTRSAELPDGVPALGTADLVWTSNVVHHIGDQHAALDTFAGVLRPGGVLAVRERGLPTRNLPRDIGLGRPGLQARIDAAQEDAFDAMRAELPGSVRAVEDWPGMLAAAGLTPTGSRTFLTDLPAPLDPPARAYVRTRLERAREALSDTLSTEDLTTLDTLLDDASPEGVTRRADVFHLTAFTVHTAVRT
ncbi:class I SAM-dependent methyltransferase [Streptomyces cacaoi]|uniref:SAM-dependent methyltransferase n=2 Tax=Streptomyces cacaoi TaxID=1898 RepID=A0A4Y3R404_STRCI|nr:class I SAM-dependent methyltransferase [Streptomyces cacaoi]NNG88502.1 methyltransferase domain-containing protein [Streptomyces cacaoi]GEB52401.1 SAM-dependent methyltransferase [Streptomyces cacaoi]